jgi:Ca2+-binding EF-hand superfamily protein
MILKREKQAEQEDNLCDAFKLFDRNSDGQITPDELHYVLSHLGENITKDDIEEMIRTIDLDGDMSINYEEFVKMMTKTPTKK